MEAEKNLLSADVQNSITLHVPSFNRNRPRVWFHQLKAIFFNRRITSQRIMFTHVVETLPSEIAEEVEDILEHPPTQKQFDVPKEAILSRLERLVNAKLRELLNNVSMGDRTPSQLLRFMKSLLGRRHMDGSIMCQFWFEKLPQAMTYILMVFSEEKTPSQLADRIADTYHQKPSVSQVSSENHREDEAVSHLCKRCSMEKRARHDLTFIDLHKASTPARINHRRENIVAIIILCSAKRHASVSNHASFRRRVLKNHTSK